MKTQIYAYTLPRINTDEYTGEIHSIYKNA